MASAEFDVIGVTPSRFGAEDDPDANPSGLSRIVLGENTGLGGGGTAVAVVAVPALTATGSIFKLLRIITEVAVVTTLLVTQYTHSAEGTFKENHPIMSGKTFKKAG
tara:strand:- start:62 stop:382 length:321 start_codon:yes stop_codon:yes gene_type:complete